MSNDPACPLCAKHGAHRAWIGATEFAGRRFEYVECVSCGSAYCDPMPDEEVVRLMYGPEYLDDAYAPGGEPGSFDADRLTEWLGRRPRGTFLDYGCGRGDALLVARAVGWDVIGLEFDPAVAANTGRVTGARTVASLAELGDARVDVLHLGDVLEHLTDMDRQLPEILAAIRPGGLLLAQGPLENHASVFLFALRAARRLRGPRLSQMPPFHVSLATLEGQRALFRRYGLRELEMRVTEVAWPAPRRLHGADLRNRRRVALFALRKVSQAAARVHPTWGNRYFFAGVIPETA